MTIFTRKTPRPPGSLVEGIVSDIAGAIAAGRLKPGDRLPNHRQLARELGVSLGTITRASRLAARRGLIRGEVGRGTFVCHPSTQVCFRAEDPSCHAEAVDVDMAMNYPVRCAAIESQAFRHALERLAACESSTALLTERSGGRDDRHANAGAQWCARAGLTVSPKHVLIATGFHGAMLAAIRHATTPGDTVLTESLTYPAFNSIADQCGVHSRGVEMDRYGIVPDALHAACRKTQATVLCVHPTNHLVTTATMPDARRDQLADVVRALGLLVLEVDDCSPLLEKAPIPLAARAPDHVVYIADPARSLRLGLRTAYVAAPPAMGAGLSRSLRETAWMNAPLMAEIATIWIEDGLADDLIEAKRHELAARHMIAMELLPAGTPAPDPASHHLWFTLPPPWRGERFAAAAMRHGVAVLSADAFAVGPLTPPAAVRLCLGVVADQQTLRIGLRRLGALLSELPSRPGVVF